MIKFILVFGASITYGAWDKTGGWVSHLRHYLDGRMDVVRRQAKMVYNLGVSGETTDDILERFDAEAGARAKNSRTIILIAVGTNDSLWWENKKRYGVDFDQFSVNVQKLINQAKKYTEQLVIIGPTPVDDQKVNPLSWDSNLFCENGRLADYNQAAQTVCRQNNILFLDLYTVLNKPKFIKSLVDGLHPGTKGQKMMFKIIKKFLADNQIITL